jgi:RHS repeat-associated protein
LDLSGTHQGAGGIGGLLFSTTQQSSNSTTAFFSYDANGNVGQLVSTNGSILARYEYDPYGKLIKEVADANVRNSPFRFSTKYIDSESGLYYYGYRYYQPEIGRWVSRDPITEKGSGVVEPKAKARLAMERYRLPYATRGSLEHAYLFVLNHPTVAVDVLGLQSLQDILHHCSAPKVWGDKPNGPAPSVNGCSLPPPLSWVIDPNNPSGHASFLNACNGHDTCYENCSTPKSVCDDVLHYGMQGACYQAGLAGDDLADCLWWADTYYWAVSSYGQGNYDAAQNAHCECRCP